MNDYISREAAIKLAHDIVVPQKNGSEYRHRCIDPQGIIELPSADVEEVIRCKDCIYFIRGNQEKNCFPFIEGEICNLRGTPYKVNKDAYCSFAERRDKVKDYFRGETADRLFKELVEERKTAKWEIIDEVEPRRYGCSNCKRMVWHIENFCPNCGAKMEG